MELYHVTHKATLLELPTELRQSGGWMGTRLKKKPNGKIDKPPYKVLRSEPITPGSKNNPDHWASFAEALEALRHGEVDAVGRAVTAEDDYTVIDLDGCRNPETGEIAPWAMEIVESIPTYWEVSLSGTGLHGITNAKKNTDRCRKGKIEVYDGSTGARFIVMTGNHLEGTPTEVRECQAEIDALCEKYLPTEQSANNINAPTEPVDLPDDELLQKAASSKYGAEFQALFSGDTSPTGGDHSRADYRLMRALLYWTGGEEARALNLFNRSGLARRQKWQRREDYRNNTLRKARMYLTTFYRTEQEHGSKRAQLGAAVRRLWRQWWSFDWTSLLGTGTRPHSMRGTTCRDVMKVLLDHADKHGRLNGAEEVRVSLGRRTIALEAATSLRTTHKAIQHLEAEGWLKFEPPESEEKPGTYIMRATLHQVLSTHTDTGERACVEGGGEDLRAPRLRWSYPGRKARRGQVKGTRRVRELKLVAKDRIERLGKIRGAVVDILDVAGGQLPLEDLYGRLHPDKSHQDRKRWRPRDLRRRTLPMLLEAGIVEVEGAVVRLTSDWMAALEHARRLGKEVEAEETARERFALSRKAFRNRHKTTPDHAPTDEELAARREAFRATLEAKRREKEIKRRDAALQAFRASGSGAAKNLALMQDGELQNVEYLVKSVLAYHNVPVVRWERVWERWREPVLEAGAIIARENAPPAQDDWNRGSGVPA